MLGLLRLLGLLPLRVHYALGRFVAWLAEDVIRYRRDVVIHNLTKCFPDKKGFIESYLKDNPVDFENMDDMTRLFEALLKPE